MGDWDDWAVTIPWNYTSNALLQPEVTRKKGSPWRDILVGPLEKLLKVPDRTWKWTIRRNYERPKLPPLGSSGSSDLSFNGRASAVTVYEDTLTIPFNSVVNRSHPFACRGGPRNRYILPAQAATNRTDTLTRGFTFVDKQRPIGSEDRMKVLEDRIKACEELRELLLSEYIKVHKSRANVGNDGGAKMGYKSVEEAQMLDHGVTQGGDDEDQRSSAVPFCSCC
ncbi:hypothetical protein HK104_002505 [Borealophlyctis nickersoniae]|nr:hypothetical protein HK104_002505 [Borealophlyctis nickersoniae]